jgi:peptidoglycan hydrolase-like protein with peptidoglycan-binding domain
MFSSKLWLGHKGATVRTLKSWLNDLALPTMRLSSNENYDASMVEAVSKFQFQNGVLRPDGVVDEYTLVLMMRNIEKPRVLQAIKEDPFLRRMVFQYTKQDHLDLKSNLEYALVATTTSNPVKESLGEKIAKTAEQNIGQTVWKTEVERVAKRNPKIRYAAKKYKCNLFVYEVLLAAGAPAPTYKSGQPVAAGDWGNPKYQIKDWRMLDPNEEVRRGDVLSRPLQGLESTGHVCIITGKQKTVGTNRDGVIAEGDFGFRWWWGQSRDPVIPLLQDKICVRRCTKE